MEFCKDETTKIKIVHACLFGLDSPIFKVSRICRYLNISREAFYYHFEDKKALLDACATELLKDFFLSRTGFVSVFVKHSDCLTACVPDQDLFFFLQAMKRNLNGRKPDFGTVFIGSLLMSMTDSESLSSDTEIGRRIEDLYKKAMSHCNTLPYERTDA